MERFILCACLMALGALAAPAVQPEAPGYRGYKLVSVMASTPEQIQFLNGLADTDYELDFWTHPMLNKHADVMVPPTRFPSFVRSLTHAGLNITVKQNDVQAMIEEVEAQNMAYKLLRTVTPFTSVAHTQYYTYDQDAGGKAMASAIKAVDGRDFAVGPPAKTIGYAAKGTSGDWAVYAKRGIISIAYELRPSSSTSNGFVLTASEIVTAGKELLRSLIAISNYVSDLNPSQNPC